MPFLYNQRLSGIMFVLVLISCALLINHVDPCGAEHILVLAVPTFSHTRNLMTVVNYVTRTYGHTATVVTSTLLANKLELRSNPEIEIIISSVFDKADFKGAETKLAKEICHMKIIGKPSSLSEKVNIVKLCDDFHNDTSLFRLLKHRQFKLAIVDNVPLAECFASLAYKLALPYIYFGVLYDPVRMRIPFSPASTPFYHRFVLSDTMSFSERVHNVLTSILMEIAPSYLVSITNIAKYISDKSTITANQLTSKAFFHLVETDFLIDYPKPALPHIAFVGGISTQPSKPLTKSFKSFMDSSVYGAVVVSLGSGLNGFPKERIDTFVEAFKRHTDFTFIIKHGNSRYIDKNIMFSPWIPQNDLLGHPKTVAFMTHCGNNGQFEALYHGIPMIGFPLFSDQYYNCERMRQKGFGVVLEFCTFGVDDIEEALRNVTTQNRYIYTIKNASTIFRGRSESPLQQASYWVDHVVRYGNKFVRSFSVDMPWYQYYLLDILMVMGILLTAVVYTAHMLLNKWKYIYCRRNNGLLNKIKRN